MAKSTTRRETLFYAASAVGAFALGRARGAYAQSERASSQMAMADHDMKACIDECEKCHRLCAETASYCLEKGGRHAAAEHVRLLLDCAEICQTSANFMLRGSAAHKTICGACAELCERCAESCETLGEDPRMKACAEACRSCAKSCRSMAKG